MRELTLTEMDMVAAGTRDTASPPSSGGPSVGDYVGNVAGAVCGVFAKKVGGAAACAAGGTFAGALVDVAIDYDFSVSEVGDPMDTKLGR